MEQHPIEDRALRMARTVDSRHIGKADSRSVPRLPKGRVGGDNEILYNNISLNVEPIHASYGAISFSSDARIKSRIRIDDVEVNISDQELRLQAEDATSIVQWKPIFVDDFEAYGNNLRSLRRGGWINVSTSYANINNNIDNKNEVSPLGQLLEAYWLPVDDRAKDIGIAIDSEDSISGLRSLRFEDVEDMSTEVVKIFSLPVQAPYDNSRRSFMVVNRIADMIGGQYRRLTRRSDSETSVTVSVGRRRFRRGEVAAESPRTKLPTPNKQTGGGDVRMASALPVGTYYIYAFDGQLLAEYNALGFCTRDYIYMGNRLIAEYHPAEDKYYYYISDQINSTRIVTDDYGTVVYAAAHDPYGGEQLTWINTYNPSLKFSGKERDIESGLDYFGARYYDRSMFRFLNADPMISTKLGLVNPQFWNLYAYCGNNPIGYIDTDGRSFLIFIASGNIIMVFDNNGQLKGCYPASNKPSSSARYYPVGDWGFDHYAPHPGAPQSADIDELGFYGFDVPSDEAGSMGVHSGRNNNPFFGTHGCIRTDRAAMQMINSLHFGGDSMEFLIVIGDAIYQDEDGSVGYCIAMVLNSVEYYMRRRGCDDNLISRVQAQIEYELYLRFGALNFLYDYFFNSESPIPPGVI